MNPQVGDRVVSREGLYGTVSSLLGHAKCRVEFDDGVAGILSYTDVTVVWSEGEKVSLGLEEIRY